MTGQTWSTELYMGAETKANLAYWKNRDKPGRSTSLRTPHRSWHNNIADQIEKQMQSDRHEFFLAMVVYCTTHDNDTHWPEGLRRLCINHYDVSKHEKREDIMERFRSTVIHDPGLFDGASTDDVRRHFQKWSIEYYKVEEPKPQQRRQHPYVHIGISNPLNN